MIKGSKLVSKAVIIGVIGLVGISMPQSKAAYVALAGLNATAEVSRVLILTGANNHNWEATTPVLKEILEASGKLNVDVCYDPGKLTENDLNAYDVLLSNWNGFGKTKPVPWPECFRKAYIEFVRKGGGHVVVHAGSSSYYDWEEYHTICNATWKNGTGHKKMHEFEVRIPDKSHPVVMGIEDFRTIDELWYKPFVQPDTRILAESYSKTTGKWEPTAFISYFGEGRCFTLLLGHNDKAMKNAGFQALLKHGTAWVAGRLVDPD